MEDMKLLKGFVNTDPDLCVPGVTTSIGGDYYNILNFDPRHITEEFVVGSLSKLARYVGHTADFLPERRIYSVGQHCVLGAQAFMFGGEVKLAWEYLWHEIEEAFLGDVHTVLKAQIKKSAYGEDYAGMVHKIEMLAADKFGLQYPPDPRIKIMDKNMITWELTFMLKVERAAPIDIWTIDETYNRFMSLIEQIKILKKYEEKDFA
jgi:hypothetical protein